MVQRMETRGILRKPDKLWSWPWFMVHGRETLLVFTVTTLIAKRLMPAGYYAYLFLTPDMQAIVTSLHNKVGERKTTRVVTGVLP